MDIFSDISPNMILAILGLLVVVPMLANFLFRPSRPTGSPPGPPVSWIPFKGNISDFKEPDKRIVFRKFRETYGDLTSLCLGSRLVVIVSGYKTMKEMFVDNGESFANRPNSYIMRQISQGKGVGGASGCLWKEHRKFGLVVFEEMASGRVGFLNRAIHQELAHLCQTLADLVDQPVDMTDMIKTSIFNYVSTLSFGDVFKHGDAKFAAMNQLMDSTISKVLVNPANSIPALRYIPGDPFEVATAIRNGKTILKYLKEFTDAKLKEGDSSTGCYADQFRKEMKRHENDANSTFQVDQLVATIWDLYLGGLDSSKNTMLWLVLYLTLHPEWQSKISQEVNQVCGADTLPSLEEKKRLVYTEAFVMETMRHANVTIHGLPKAAAQNTTFKGYTFPEETTVLPDVDSVFTDPNIWADPDTFQPERFISSEGTLKRPDEFIPFSLGIRTCLAEAVIQVYLVMFVASLVQRYSFSIPPGGNYSLQSLDGTFDLSHGPKPYAVVASRK